MMFDSTPDISHKDYTSQVPRYITIDGDKVKAVESFVDFIESKGKPPRIFQLWFWKNYRKMELIFKIAEGMHMIMLLWWQVDILVFKNVSGKLIKTQYLFLAQITRSI